MRIIQQIGDNDCGYNVALMICDHYGIMVSLPYLKQYFNYAELLSYKDLHDFFETVGIRSVCGILKEELLYQIPLPSILHYENHFAILCDTDPILIADSSKGWLKPSMESFKRTYLKNYFLVLEPTW